MLALLQLVYDLDFYRISQTTDILTWPSFNWLKVWVKMDSRLVVERVLSSKSMIQLKGPAVGFVQICIHWAQCRTQMKMLRWWCLHRDVQHDQVRVKEKWRHCGMIDDGAHASSTNQGKEHTLCVPVVRCHAIWCERQWWIMWFHLIGYC